MFSRRSATVVIDHYSRRIMGFAVYRQQPTYLAVRRLIDRITRDTELRPE